MHHKEKLELEKDENEVALTKHVSKENWSQILGYLNHLDSLFGASLACRFFHNIANIKLDCGTF